MRTAVEDIHHRHRKHLRVRPPEILVEWQAYLGSRSLGHCHRHPQNRIGSQVLLIPASIKSQHGGIHARLVCPVHSQQCGGDLLVHVIDRAQHTLAEVAASISIPQLPGFVLPCARATGHARAAKSSTLKFHINFHGGISA